MNQKKDILLNDFEKKLLTSKLNDLNIIKIASYIDHLSFDVSYNVFFLYKGGIFSSKIHYCNNLHFGTKPLIDEVTNNINFSVKKAMHDIDYILFKDRAFSWTNMYEISSDIRTLIEEQFTLYKYYRIFDIYFDDNGASIHNLCVKKLCKGYNRFEVYNEVVKEFLIEKNNSLNNAISSIKE